MEGPRVFATLIEEATKPSIKHFEEELRDSTERFNLSLQMPVQQVIQEAYRKGLIDGFQQGVAAECNRRDRIREESKKEDSESMDR